MAQIYVGTNNINYLQPIGQFGTRNLGGKDAASARYIYTNLNPITRKIFKEDDDHILNYLDDDGQQVEPRWYMPIIPTCLVNGGDGIGTGWSTTIPCYNPLQIAENIKRKLNGKVYYEMEPWY
jgi:DNA topoisomerase-2